MNNSNLKSRVLVVDDEPQILTSVQDLLEDDFAVSTASDADTALRLLQQVEVAVILSDQRMPGMSGDQFLQRANEISRATRLLITAYADMEALVRAVNHGQIYAYLAKPWDPLELKVTVLRAADHYNLTRQISQERDLLHALMDNVPDTIYFKDIHSRFTRINRPHAELLGVYAPQEAIGKTDADFVPAEYARETLAEEQGILSSWKPIKDKVEKICKPGGDLAWYSTTKVPIIDADERVAGIVGISREITERKKAEDALAQQAEELARYNAELEEFAYVAAHDLQEPLRSVASFTQILAQRYRGRLDADADKYVDLVVGGAQRMRSLIDDLLAYSRVARRQGELKPTDAQAVFHRSLDSLADAVKQSRATITSDPLPTVMADPARLDQVFQNLIGNALKFRGAAAPEVHISAEQRREEWVFSVRDNGIGIDSQHADRIFEIFERLHGKHQYSGNGIGLAICRRIVERHHGRIWVESLPGQGSTFYFTIPAQPVC